MATAALRHRQLGAWLVGQQQFLERRSADALQRLPLLDGHENGRFPPAPRHDLRSLGKAGVEQFAEPGLGVLNGPLGHVLDSGFRLTSLQTSCRRAGRQLVSTALPSPSA